MLPTDAPPDLRTGACPESLNHVKQRAEPLLVGAIAVSAQLQCLGNIQKSQTAFDVCPLGADDHPSQLGFRCLLYTNTSSTIGRLVPGLSLWPRLGKYFCYT